MARPDTDDGWFKIAHELDAALAVADFTKGARIVLHEVFSQCYGPAGRRSATLSPAEIGRRIGLPRQNVGRAIQELTDSGALRRLDDGTYAFVKDYESWTDGKAAEGASRRLSRVEVAFVASAPAMAMSYKCRSRPKSPKNPSSELMTHKRSSGINSDDKPGDPVINSDDGLMTLPVEERASGARELNLRLRIKKTHTQEGGGVVCPSVTSESNHTPAPGLSLPADPPASPSPPPDGWTSEDVLRVVALAERLFPMLEFGRGVCENSHLYPPHFFERALEDAANRGKRVGFSYVLGICRRYMADGGPAEIGKTGVGVRPRGGEVPYRPVGVPKLDPVQAEAVRKAEFDRAKRVRVEARRKQEIERVARSDWEALPGPDREALIARFRAENPGLVRFPAQIEKLCLEHLARRIEFPEGSPP